MVSFFCFETDFMGMLSDINHFFPCKKNHEYFSIDACEMFVRYNFFCFIFYFSIPILGNDSSKMTRN